MNRFALWAVAAAAVVVLVSKYADAKPSIPDMRAEALAIVTAATLPTPIVVTPDVPTPAPTPEPGAGTGDNTPPEPVPQAHDAFLPNAIEDPDLGKLVRFDEPLRLAVASVKAKHDGPRPVRLHLVANENEDSSVFEMFTDESSSDDSNCCSNSCSDECNCPDSCPCKQKAKQECTRGDCGSCSGGGGDCHGHGGYQAGQPVRNAARFFHNNKPARKAMKAVGKVLFRRRCCR